MAYPCFCESAVIFIRWRGEQTEPESCVELAIAVRETRLLAMIPSVDHPIEWLIGEQIDLHPAPFTPRCELYAVEIRFGWGFARFMIIYHFETIDQVDVGSYTGSCEKYGDPYDDRPPHIDGSKRPPHTHYHMIFQALKGSPSDTLHELIICV